MRERSKGGRVEFRIEWPKKRWAGVHKSYDSRIKLAQIREKMPRFWFDAVGGQVYNTDAKLEECCRLTKLTLLLQRSLTLKLGDKDGQVS